jgi:hypothetical protein
MPRPANAQTLGELRRLLAAARSAEEVRLAGLTAEAAACRARAAGLRQAMVLGAPEAADAAALGAALRWQHRLGLRARDEEARARQLESEAASARRRLARAFGREQALARLLEQAAAEARRRAGRRADWAAPAQSSPSDSRPAGTSAGSPGMA